MKKPSTLFDYIFTFATEFLILAAGILVYRLASSFLGDDGFSEYAVVRRTISFIQPVLMIGVGVGLPRYVAFSLAEKGRLLPGTYLRAATLVLLAAGVFFILVSLLFEQSLARLFFGAAKYSTLIWPLNMCVIGLLMHSLAYSFLRGKIQMIQANFLQMVNLGIVPFAAFWFSHSVEAVLFFTGLGWTLVGAFAASIRLLREKSDSGQIAVALKELLNYGIRRVPGDMLIMGLLSIPAFFAASMYDDNLSTAGDVAFSMSLLNMAGAVFAPICLILLPQASRIIAESDFSKLGKISRELTLVTLGLCVLGMLAIWPFLRELLGWYLGSDRPALTSICQVVLFACFGYCLYISLRSILDAFYVKAVNSMNIFISFVAFIAGAVWAWFTQAPVHHYLLVFVAAMTLLGILTWLRVMGLIKTQSVNESPKKV